MKILFSHVDVRSPGAVLGRYGWLAVVLSAACAASSLEPVVVSSNHRFLETSGGRPFFWLGDTAWLLFQKLDRAQVERYLENRRLKGFNVIQAVALHSAVDRNAYAATALIDGDPGRPAVTPGSDLSKAGEYDYWDHVDWVVDRAAAKGVYVAMVAAWGSLVRGRKLTIDNASDYGRFLAERYRERPNVLWIIGGDARGDRDTEVWRALARAIKAADPSHLMTFHPFGRTQSSTWLHREPWLDFNMFQSGHRRYDQDDTPQPKGEDNWRYVQEDYAKTPPKPTIDGEPSYEGIPQGLHDPSQPRWQAADCRRYAYWSVFAGAFGHTYGDNAVMQMNRPGDKVSYAADKYWDQAMDDPGAAQMHHLKDLILSHSFFDRVPDQGLIAGENGERYDYIAATRGRDYALLYTYTGRPFDVRMGRIAGPKVRAAWFNPRTGEKSDIGVFANRGVRRFVPRGIPHPGNDWVLVLESDFG